MAKIKKTRTGITYNGIIYYHSNGQDLARSKPTVVRQNAATKTKAVVFGKGCHIAAMFRLLLKAALPDPGDRVMMRSFEKAMREWLYTDPLAVSHQLNDLPFLNGHQFNAATAVYERMKKPLVVQRAADGSILTDVPELIPAKDIGAKAGTLNIRLKIVAATLHLDGDTAMANYSTNINLPYNYTKVPAQQLVLPIHTAPGNLTLVALALQYNTNAVSPGTFITDKPWTPAGIIGAFYN